MIDTSAEDAALVARAAAGDASAFRVLYRRHVGGVYRVAFAVLRRREDAEDVTQETFLTAWRKLPDLNLAGSSLLPWLAAICRNHGANRLRAVRRDEAAAVHGTGVDEAADAAAGGVEAVVIAADLATRIADTVDRLSELDREIFLLCVAEGCGYADAAARLGVGHGTVRNRLSRLRSRLRETVEEANG
jgi:RNA polymerase sigma-70 factor (ECF subfamily)